MNRPKDRFIENVDVTLIEGCNSATPSHTYFKKLWTVFSQWPGWKQQGSISYIGHSGLEAELKGAGVRPGCVAQTCTITRNTSISPGVLSFEVVFVNTFNLMENIFLLFPWPVNEGLELESSRYIWDSGRVCMHNSISCLSMDAIFCLQGVWPDKICQA